MYLVGFSTPRAWNPLSWLIRVMTGSKASHAFLLFDDPVLDVRLVLEAHSTGYRLVGLDEFVTINKVVAIASSHPAPVPPGVRPLGLSVKEGLHATGIWLGARFDIKGLFGIFLTLLRGFFSKRRLRNPFRSSKSLFCSEAVVRTLQAGRHPCVAGLDPESVGPQQLIDLLRADPGSVLVFGDIPPRSRTKQEVAQTRAYAERLFRHDDEGEGEGAAAAG